MVLCNILSMAEGLVNTFIYIYIYIYMYVYLKFLFGTWSMWLIFTSELSALIRKHIKLEDKHLTCKINGFIHHFATNFMYIYIYIYFFFFSIIQRMKARAIPCPHQPPTRGDNAVLVAQGGTATPGATQQLLPPDRVLRELYIYIYIYIYN